MPHRMHERWKKITARIPKADAAKLESSALKENQKDGSSVEARDRKRESLMYEADDLNTLIPKLEKRIEKVKVWIRLQHEDATKSKKKSDVNPSSDINRNEKKIEASAQNFKTFDGEKNRPKSDDRRKKAIKWRRECHKRHSGNSFRLLAYFLHPLNFCCEFRAESRTMWYPRWNPENGYTLSIGLRWQMDASDVNELNDDGIIFVGQMCVQKY